MTGPVDVISFGYLHGPPPEAHLTLDLRHHFRDPHVSPELRHLTGHDQPVREAVLRTPGILALVDATADAVAAFLAGPGGGGVRVAVGCAGGRHRAAVTASALQLTLADERITVHVTHRDLDKPVVQH